MRLIIPAMPRYRLSRLEAKLNRDADFAEFFKGYTQCLGFTASGYTCSGDSTGSPLFNVSQPGGCFDDFFDVWSLIKDVIEATDLDELVNDCWSFFCEAKEEVIRECETLLAGSLLNEDSGESVRARLFYRAGTHFHFTRNGHGAGFDDGDWDDGTKLSEIANPYGALELEGIVCDNGRILSLYLIH